jgi:hypothetical protein
MLRGTLFKRTFMVWMRISFGCLLIVTWGFVCESPEAAFARSTGLGNAAKAREGEEELLKAREEFGVGGFKDPLKMARFVLVIAGAAALGAVIAFHPFASQRSASETSEQPKTIITYTVVGALIAIVVAPIPAMAFAIFGIGGLMRFRTQVGAAKDTGRVILATILGLLCGLEFWMAALLGTVMAWILIFLIESRTSMRMVVRGIPGAAVPQSAEAYSRTLRGLRCSFTAPRKNPNKGQISFQLHAPRKATHEEIEARLDAEVPKELKGTVDWPED